MRIIAPPRCVTRFAQTTLRQADDGTGRPQLPRNYENLASLISRRFSALLHRAHGLDILHQALHRVVALSDHNTSPSEEERMVRSLFRILVVDDERDTADSLAMLLTMSGHPANPAYDAASALSVARRYAPYLVFLDLAMPEVDGFRLAEQLRGLPGMDDAVLVCLTGYAGPEYQERARQAGFAHFLPKPVDPQEVVRLVDDIVDPVLSAV